MEARGMSSIERQIDKIFRHTRQGSYGTRARYRGTCINFGKFLADRYKMQNVKNLGDKHVVAYIKHRQEQGLAPKTIKNDLAAIRYLHDQLPRTRNNLSSNQKLQQKYSLKFEKTPNIKGNRAWTQQEYENAKNIAIQQGKPDYAHILTLARTMGLRITEAVAVSRAQAERALREGIYHVGKEAKNGKERDVPLSLEVRRVFQEKLKETARGNRLFIDVKAGEKTHEVVYRAEKWLEDIRGRAETQEGRESRWWHDKSTPPLTYHGLRYSYVQERMEHLQNEGFSRDAAAQIVSQEVGHERIEVISIYTAGK